MVKRNKIRRHQARAAQVVAALGAVQPLVNMAEYRRTDETEILIPESVILTELSTLGALNKRRSHHLGWILPADQEGRGEILELEHFSLEIENSGIFDVEMLVQQPHGYAAEPSGIASWVLLEDKRMVSGQKVHLTVHPVSNSFVVPLRGELKGRDAVIFAAFSLSRQAISSAGDYSSADTEKAKVLTSEVGLKIKAKVTYKAAGNNLGNGEYFGMRSYSDDMGMFWVDNKPPTPIAVANLANQASYISWGQTEQKLLSPQLWTSNGDVVSDDRWFGVSRTHYYRLPITILGGSNKGPQMGCYIRYFSDRKKWLVVRDPLMGPSEALWAGDGTSSPTMDKLPMLTGDSCLVPVSDFMNV